MNDNSPHIPLKEYPKAPDLEMGLRIIFGRGIFERTSFENFMKHIKTRDTALEVGSHVGSWTLGFSRLFNNVLGFEPHPQNRQYLEDNIARTNQTNIRVFPYAVVNDVEQRFRITESGATRNSGMAHLIPETAANDRDPVVVGVRLDDFLNVQFPDLKQLNALKIDVEGLELDVLKSAAEALHTFKPAFLLEINRNCKRYDVTKEQILDEMNDRGYSQADRTRNDYIFVPDQQP